MDRCKWVNLNNPAYIEYHDREWSQPQEDDRKLFELLILEGFQAGLSWECILNKRASFQEAFDHFDPSVVASYGEEKKAQLAQNAAIVRNKRKIDAAVKNACVFLAIQKEYGSFLAYLKGFAGPGVIEEPYDSHTTSPLSDAISKDLKKRGMSFVGSTIIYSYLQAVGIINAHGPECDLYPGRKK
ncbi:MAG: DNA-3-methyladenine glycosylase I [Firmicutes bacterium]|nr:DNA-3-methyladenine glycosylase I [Bacillota bacterium]